MNSVLISLIMVIPAAVTIIRWRSGIVYTNTITVFTGAVAAFLTGRPHIWHIHEFLNEDHGLKFMFGKNLSLGLIGRLSAKCIIASKSIADALQGFIPSSKMKVIYQSVSISSSVMPMQKKSSAFKCLLVGKISEGKNQEEAVRAVAEVAKNGMAIELYLIGDGYEDYIAHLNNIIEQEGVRHNIRFMGYQNDAFSHMCIADVVLMCSRSEGFGRVTVEGMLAGKVVIGSRSGATPELIQDGVTGLLYTLGDYKDLANKIQYLHDHSAQVSLMGKNAQEWAVRNFSEERYGMDLMQVFLNITKSDDRHNKSSIKENSKD